MRSARPALILTLLASIAALTACGDDDAAPRSGDTSANNAATSTNNATTSANNATTRTNNGTTRTNNATTSTGPFEPMPIVWEPCDLVAEAPPEAPDTQAECASIPVPLDWADPQGPTLDLYVKRIEPPNPAEIDLWMVNGGPGGASNVFEQLISNLSPAWGNVRVYLTDARGAGRSTKLDCPNAQAEDSPGGAAILSQEWPDCIAEAEAPWGPGSLDRFDTTSAATDLLFLAEHTRDPNATQFAYGVSYGTFWLHRTLQLDPDAWTGVILDSIVPPDEPNLSEIDAWHDEAGRAVLERCGRDPDCSAALGGDAVAATEELFDMLDAGHCPDLRSATLSGRELLRLTFGVLISTASVRGLIPALVHRARRCSDDDMRVLTHAIERTLGRADAPPSLSAQLFSVLLSRHVVFSELWGHNPPDASALDAIASAALASKDIGRAFGPDYASWPRYTPDAFAGQWAATDAPMLMLNSDLDPQTPLRFARPARSVYSGDHQTFVVLRGASHGAAFSSVIRGGRTTCGILLMTQFMRDPTAPLDTSCTRELDLNNLDVSRNVAAFFLDTDDLYGLDDDTP